MRYGHRRRDWLVLAAASLLAAPRARAGEVRAWPAGQAAGPLPVQDPEGRPWAPPAGKAVLVNFWATWCPPCRAEMPALQDLADIYADKLTVVAVNFKERPSTVQRFVRESRLALPVVMDTDGAAAAAWGVKVFPSSFLLTPDRKPRWRIQGEHEWNGAAAGQLVESLWR
jgi:thiol-disulfide isomerase/thioredoxin